MFALLKRLLEHEGYDVTLVENITDVNDKIYDAARRAGVPSERLAREMTEAYRADTDRLGLGRPDHEPLASETIDEIIDLIEALIERGHAYAAEGDVYFSVRSFHDYGKLSNRRLEDLEPADQGEPDEEQARKRDPLDFALWKAQKAGRGHGLGLAVGPRPPGLAHRVLGDGRGDPRPRLRHPRRRLRPDVPAPRERDRADRGRPRPSRSRGCGCTTA